MRGPNLTLLLLLGLVPSGIALAETATLTAVADTALFSFNPNNNYGKLTTLPLGAISRPGQEGRVLLRFDVAAALPSNAVISSVSLRLRVTKEPGGGAAETVDLHRMLVPWVEGSKSTDPQGATATAGETSWSSRVVGGGNWAAPGGQAGTDFATAVSGSVTLDNPATYTATGAGLVADVQAWLQEPANNFGWMIRDRPPLESRTAKRIGSREGSASQAPQLTVEYTVPVPPLSPAFSSVGRVGDALELRFQGLPGNLYAVEYQDTLGAATWQTLTNIPVKLAPAEAVVLESLTAPGRFYRLGIVGQID
jgi:hypothetical protein